MPVWLRRLAWLAGAYVALCALAWKAVPWGVRRALAQVPQSLPGFSAGAEDVRFNPFSLRLSLRGVSFKQEKFGEVAACRLFSVALAPADLLRLAVGLREVKLVGPRLALLIGPDGGSVLDALPKTEAKTAAQAQPVSLPRLVVGLLDVSDGELELDSRLRRAPQRLAARPIAFRLRHLSTIRGEGGRCLLEARSDRGEALDWTGEMTLRPVHAWGRVALRQADLSRLATAAPDLPVSVAQGRLDAATDYDVALQSGTLRLGLKDSRLAVAGLLWRLKAAGADTRGPFDWDLGPGRLFLLAPAGRRITLEAQTRVSGSGAARLKAYLAPKPLSGGADLQLAGVALRPFSALAPPPTQVALDSGTLDLRLRAAASGGEARAELSLALSDLALSQRASGRPLLRLGRLRVDSARLSTKDRRVEVAAVGLERPWLRLARLPDGRTNVAAALGAPALRPQAAADPPAAAAAPRPAAATAAAWQGRLGRLSVSEGRLLVQDEAVSPPFALNVSGAQAQVTDLATDARSAAAFSARADVERSPFSASGTVRLSSAAAWIEARLQAERIQLPSFSTYGGKYLGYKLDKGAFSFQLDDRLADRAISARNHITIDQLTLGAKVESPDAVKAPVKLGLAILRDRRGVIDLDLPIDGSLDDPDFHLGSAIVKVLLNLVVKAAVSPFTVLSQMLGAKDDLGRVSFAPGDPALSAAAAAQLEKVAQALADRPQLSVGVRGAAGRPDAAAAGDRVLLAKLRGARGGAAPLTPKEEAKLRGLYRQSFKSEAPDLAQARAGLDLKWGASDAELRALALARAGAIKDALVSRGVAAARFFDLDPAAAASAADAACQLQLDLR